MRRRERVVVAVAALAAALAVGGVIGATFIKSPAEIARETAPPKRAQLEARVRRERLSETTVFRGLFKTTGDVAFTPQSEVAPNGHGPEAERLVITALVTHAGEEVMPGQVVAEVSGRPVFVLPGRFPAFRNLVQGDVGPDVTELQAALSSLGLLPYPNGQGVFGTATADAVRAFYRRIGYATPTVPSDSGKHPGSVVEVPASEVMFVPKLPATLVAAPTAVGQDVSGEMLKVSQGGLRLTASLSAAAARRLRVGQRVTVFSTITGKTTHGTIASRGTAVVSASTASSHVPVTIAAASGSWAASWAGQNVQLTVKTMLTAHPVWTVPVSALYSSANGQTVLHVAVSHRHYQVVNVRVGANANGHVAVVPLGGARLRVDERVQVS